MKFRTKPVVVEAKQLTRRSWGTVYDFVGRKRAGRPAKYHTGIWILTPNGPIWLAEGCWIIRAADGTLSVCKPDVFAATYERVEEEG